MNRSAKAAKAPKSEPKVASKWRGVDLQKVDAKILAETIERLELKVAPDSGVKGLVDSYVDHIATQLEVGEEPFVCDNCGAPSTDGDAACEACGSAGGVVDEPTTGIVTKPEAPEVEPKPATVAKLTPKRTIVDPSVSAEGIVVGTVADLDASVAQIRDLTQRSLNGYYELGRALVDCYDRGLYKLRVADGRPTYSTWTAFVEAECGITRQQAGNVMALAVEFSPEQIKEIGPTRLRVVLRAPIEFRAQLLEKASSGSYRELAKDLAKLAPGRVGRPPLAAGEGSGTRRGRHTSLLAAPEPRETSRVPKGSVSTMVTFGRVELNLKKCKHGKVDALQTTESLSDGCLITYTVVDKKLVIDRKPSV